MKTRGKRAFTLLEILVVVAVLVVVAGGVVLSLGGVREEASIKVSWAEAIEIRNALRFFKRDTGYLPKQGPFALKADGGDVDPLDGAHWPSYAPAAAADREKWFRSPANFYQLFERPFGTATHFLNDFDKKSGRGWRGPYLAKQGEGFVDVGEALQPDGSGSPVTGAALQNLRGVADPFDRAPVGNYLTWRLEPGLADHARWGSPYFLFMAHPGGPRLVGMGPDGNYDGGTGDDIFIPVDE